jgi:hypothetical protein
MNDGMLKGVFLAALVMWMVFVAVAIPSMLTAVHEITMIAVSVEGIKP